MPGRDIIVVGASAGGVEALTQVTRGLPADLPAAVFVVLHVPAHGTSVLPKILSRNGPLPARHPVDGDAIEPGTIAVAPPGAHILLRDGRIRLSRGPRENGHRPSVDPLFRTAAQAFGPRVAGVILSGTLDDGTAGLAAIKGRGGVSIVQSPEDAIYPGMPRSALEHTRVDHTLAAASIPALLSRLAREPLPATASAGPVTQEMQIENAMSEFDFAAMNTDDEHPGTPSGFGCPDCGGALWEMQAGDFVRFRCRVGHAWSAHSLLAQQSESMEAALWSALRVLEERASLADRLARRLLQGGKNLSSRRFATQADEARQRAALLRQVLIAEPTSDAEAPPSAASMSPEPAHRPDAAP